MTAALGEHRLIGKRPYTGMTRQRENEEYEPRQLDYDTGLPMTQAVRAKQLPAEYRTDAETDTR